MESLKLQLRNASGKADYSSATRLVALEMATNSATEYLLTVVGLRCFPDYYEKHYTNYMFNTAIDPRSRMTSHNG